jgi:hypothetical protein
MIPPFIPHSVKLKSESSCFIDGCISNVDAMCFRTLYLKLKVYIL